MNQFQKKACCYTIDENYLFPTLLSAIQTQRATPGADVIVICVGDPSPKSRCFEKVFREHDIRFRHAGSGVIDDLGVPFARFFLHRMLDENYDSVVYLDGDTQILDDLNPLLDAPLRPGTFLAARDPMAIVDGSVAGTNRHRYLASIGIKPSATRLYCNSGVLRFNLADWEGIGRDVIAASAARKHCYRFPDQDPLNIAFGEQYLTMSYRWNFPSFFLGLGLQDIVSPRVLHFMSNPRPWNGPFRPWGRPYHRVYRTLVQRFPQIAPFAPRRSIRHQIKYYVQQHVKGFIEGRTWRKDHVVRQIAKIEHEALI